MYYNEVLFFAMILKHIHTFVRAWRQFKNSVRVEIVLLPSQPCTASHFQFHSYAQVEVTDCEQLWMEENNLYCDTVLKLVPYCDKCMNMLEDHGEK